MNDLTISIQSTEDLTTLTVQGSARAIDSQALDRKVREILVIRPRRLVVDLSGISFVASTALALLAHLCRGIRADGGIAEVHGASSQIAEVIRHARLDDILPLVDEPALPEPR